MQYQAESLAQALRLAEAKAQELVRAVPESLAPQLESHAFLLQLEVQKVLRQAVALQQLAALPKVAPLMEPPHLSQSERRRLEIQQQGLVAVEGLEQEALAMARELAEAEAQVEVLPPQAGELVEVPLQGLE